MRWEILMPGLECPECQAPYSTVIDIVSYSYCMSEYIKKMATAILSDAIQTECCNVPETHALGLIRFVPFI